MNRTYLSVLVMLFAAKAACALGPHEIAVLVNDRSDDSVRIAAAFIALRRVPDSNVIHLRLPPHLTGSPSTVSPKEFTDFIWDPASRAIRERGIDDHVLAWVYSAGFPTRIATEPVLSVQGLTFLRNRLPEPEQVKAGTYVSPLFTGPHAPRKQAHLSRTLDRDQRLLGGAMPLPSMMLGYTGERGNTVDAVLRCLERGAASDASYPAGTVYFVLRDDVRSRCREWQFPMAQEALTERGIEARITQDFPRSGPVLGIMTGAAGVTPKASDGYVVGSMAEHLTSAAALFSTADQTKLSAWIDAGVAGTAGTVAEPFALWPKFPSAWFFVHYASGCTMLESFYQSVRCPLQLLVVGDPLARPWGCAASVVLEGLGDAPVAGVLEVTATVTSEPPRTYRRFMVLVDGTSPGEALTPVAGGRFRVDTSGLAVGRHRLRVVAYSTELVRDQAFVEKVFTVAETPRDAGQAKNSSRQGRDQEP